MGTALITGASAGLGVEFARQLAAQRLDLVLVARDEQRLTRLATELTAAYGIAAEVLPADLADRAQLQRVADRVADAGRPVDVLVNNAGFGPGRALLDVDIAAEERLLDVLGRAVLVLSLTAADAMRGRGRGQIVNVASVAGFLATGTYSASKRYVIVVTQSLAAALTGTGVTATAICPGFVRTEFHDRAGRETAHLPEYAWIRPETVVRQGLADARRGRPISVPTWRYKAAAALLGIAPNLVVSHRSLVSRRAERQ